MKLYAPDYYPLFACLMGDCRHTCCAGWEIDIDEETMARYARMEGGMGLRIRENIVENDGVFSFRLTADERCPFLRKDGLCDMIAHLGKDSLCQICADHPRFRNHFTDHTEIGLGLCCEGAAKLILTNPAPVSLALLEDDGESNEADADEEALLALRAHWIRIAQNRSLSFDARLKALEGELSFPMEEDITAYVPFLLSLERLDEAWTKALKLLSASPCATLPPSFDPALEQLLVYLLFRHVPAALEDGDAEGKLCYALFVCRLIMALGGVRLAQEGALSMEELCDLCRMYSSEIEYSDENLCALMEALN